MLSIKDLTKSVGPRTLFKDASLQIGYGEKVALVGPNGAGKTTLFSIILGEVEADSGVVEKDEWSMIGFLPQESEPEGDETVIEVATGRSGVIGELETTLSQLEADGKVDSPEYYDAQAKFDALSDPEFEAKSKKMLKGLGFKETDFERPVKEMSGGWIMRAHLARLLVMEPDLLMLDEPTNHLDLVSLLWFQDYLKNYPNAILMISHDRAFMDEVVDNVHEICEQKIIAYKGNYSKFLVLKEENYQRQLTSYKNQQKEIKDIQDFINKFRSVSSKAALAQSRQKQLDKMTLIEKPISPPKVFRFQFPQPERSGHKVIELENIHKAYGDLKIYQGIDLLIERGDRTVLVGPNGAGKSTLLKILAGTLEFENGNRIVGNTTNIGYFSQHRSELLDPNNTVLDEVQKSAPSNLSEEDARGILGSFRFRKEEIYKRTSVLSGGEKTRLNLIKFLVDPPNLLLLDEPTTHLDILTVESLILALEKFEGTIVFISHDVHFIRSIATKVLHVNKGQVTPYYGGYDYYLEKSGQSENEREALTSQ
jgi:ATP-binding cassette subfamily F protein 3